MIIASFLFFLLMFVVIGMLSMRKRKETAEDYLLASQNVKPWLVGLSAVATNNSGYMFVGQIGFTYEVGLYSIWLMIGWIFGDFMTSLLVHKRLRIAADDRHVLSFPGLISRWHGTDFKYLRLIGGLITIMFLGVYAAAQLKAGSKALHVLFEWDYSVGAIIGAVMVLLYCFAGGIRASIWTDAAQSFVMIVAMALMLGMGIYTFGGWGSFVDNLDAISPTYMNLFPADVNAGFISPALFVLGWVFAGVSVIGQPHIMVRFMAMDDASSMKAARFYYYGWYTLFYAMTIVTAMAARLLLPDVANFDAELALPTLAMQMLPDIFVGLVLAGLFAAMMSTADSQILSCTASITHDIPGLRMNSYLMSKLATVFVTAMALMIALFGDKLTSEAGGVDVFSLVLVAWSSLGAAFGPLLIVLALRQKVAEALSILMMVTGFGTVLLWRYFDLNDYIYEAAPGILAGLAVFVIGKAFDFAETVPPKDVAEVPVEMK